MDKQAKERVAIAKDALKWLEAGALVAQKMCYVYPEHRPTEAEMESGKQLRDIVLGKCTVCALGGLFLAKAVRFDQVLVSEWDDAGNIRNGALTQHFCFEQLHLIERCFEGWDGVGKEYLAQYPDHKERMTAILRNIISNRGKFCP